MKSVLITIEQEQLPRRQKAKKMSVDHAVIMLFLGSLAFFNGAVAIAALIG